jgi:hydroxyacylglutathione hydrolase
VAALTHSVSGGEQFELFGETFLVLDLPGHTLGHVGYVGGGKLFCGDVLFSAGCGRIFEGSPEQMYESIQKIAALPDETEIYPAHEYTSSNITFALAAEPDNEALLIYRDKVNRLRTEDKPTLPTTLKQEKEVNPFLRTHEPSIARSVANRTTDTSSIEIFTALRRWKDDF